VGQVWSWEVVKRNVEYPYIKIPKHVREELKERGPGVYYVLLFEDEEEARWVLELLQYVKRGIKREASRGR